MRRAPLHYPDLAVLHPEDVAEAVVPAISLFQRIGDFAAAEKDLFTIDQGKPVKIAGHPYPGLNCHGVLPNAAPLPCSPFLLVAGTLSGYTDFDINRSRSYCNEIYQDAGGGQRLCLRKLFRGA